MSSVQPARGAVLPMWGEMTQPLDQALHSLDDAGPRLSKSRLLAYRPCERRRWLDIHRRNLLGVSVPQCRGRRPVGRQAATTTLTDASASANASAFGGSASVINTSISRSPQAWTSERFPNLLASHSRMT